VPAMRLRFLLVFRGRGRLHAVRSGAEPGGQSSLELWEGLPCRRPTHARTYVQLQRGARPEDVVCTEVTVAGEEGKLAPLALLRRISRPSAQERVGLYWMGVASTGGRRTASLWHTVFEERCGISR